MWFNIILDYEKHALAIFNSQIAFASISNFWMRATVSSSPFLEQKASITFIPSLHFITFHQHILCFSSICPLNMSDFESSRLAFDNAISIITEDYKQLPDADELIAKITRKFTQLYNDPHVSDFKKVVGDVNIDDARSLLFNPTVLQRRYETLSLPFITSTCLMFIDHP